MTQTVSRCVNLDWLEVYCVETQPRPWSYFHDLGFEVQKREYGTPMYREMFTILDHGAALIEVRRDPYQVKSQGGIFEDGACHIRLSNRTCYYPDPVGLLRRFIIEHEFFYKGITRVDICLDFLHFDFGDDPLEILKSYMEGKISKINQANVAAHGTDQWDGRYWNSLKWGSETSMVTTKLYNKTMELNRPGHDKFYIRDEWERCGLCSRQITTYQYENKDGTTCTRYGCKYVAYGTAKPEPIPQEQCTEVQIWRVEFSVKSNARHWVNLQSKEFHLLTLNNIDSRQKLIFLFHSLAAHYFHFKTLIYTREGTIQRKDRCPDKVLFITSQLERAYKPKALPTAAKQAPSWIMRVTDELRKLTTSQRVPDNIAESANYILQQLWEQCRLWGVTQRNSEIYDLKAMSKTQLLELYRKLRSMLEAKQLSF